MSQHVTHLELKLRVVECWQGISYFFLLLGIKVSKYRISNYLLGCDIYSLGEKRSAVCAPEQACE